MTGATGARWRLLSYLVSCVIVAAACSSSATPAPTTSAGATSPAQPATPPATAAGGPRSGGVLVFARNQEPVSLSPAGDNGDNGTIFTVVQIFDQLVEVGPSGFDPVPGLAESWTESSDQLSYTFKLRAAKFSNGDPVTADDVKFSLARFVDPNIDTEYSSLGQTIKAVTVVDPSTVQIDLTRVDGAFLAEISVFAASIVPQKVVEDIGDEAFAEHPVGSGPFMLDTWTRGQSLKLVKNPYYWKEGQPYLDGVTFRFVKDDNARVLGLQAGDFDVAETVPFASVAQLSSGNGTRVQSDTIMSLDNICFNNARAPLDEKAVRQALNYATPRDAILKSIYLDLGTVANSQLPQNEYWDASIAPYPYDIAKAQSLLASSSVPNGFDIGLMITAGDTVAQQVATIVKDEWAKIGVQVTISQVDDGTASTAFQGGDYDAMWRNVSSDITTDDELASLLLDINAGLHSWFTWYDSPQAAQIIADANGTSDQATRRAKFSELQALALDDAPKLPLIFPAARQGVRDRVQDFKTVPTAWWKLEDVWLTE